MEVSCQDNLFDHLMVRANIGHSHRLAQCRELKMNITSPSLWLQVDGEAFRLEQGTLTFAWDRHLEVLQGPEECINVKPIGRHVKRYVAMLINPRSGGRRGNDILEAFQALADGGPVFHERLTVLDINTFRQINEENLALLRRAFFPEEKETEEYEAVERFLVCAGGDGTAKW
jgi:hypothetical protein